MRIRKIFFWSHLVAGVAVGLVVLMLAGTGALLTYENQITRWAQPDVSAPHAVPLSADIVAQLAMDASLGQASSVTFQNDPDAAITVAIGRSDRLFLDPVTGEELAAGGAGVESFFASVESLHRWLSLSGRSDSGAAMTGAANLVFGLLLLSGVYLWWPKRWAWRFVRLNVLFRRGLPNAKARDYNWHHVFGFWALVPLLAIMLSGAVISYSWASDMVFAIYGEEPSGLRRGARGGSGTELILPDVGLQAVLQQAQAHDEDWNRITLSLPKSQGAATAVRATVDTGTGRQPALQDTLVVSGADGSVTTVERFEDRSDAQQARVFLRYLHTGEVFGILGQTIAGLASLAALFMTYTGLALSWRRLIWPLMRKSGKRV